MPPTPQRPDYEAYEENPEFDSTLDRFRAKLEEFNRAYNALLARKDTADLSPELRAEYDKLMARAETIRTQIRRAQEAIDWVRMQVNQAASTFNGLGNLGFLPIIAWGAAIGAMTLAIGAMSYWLSGAYEWSKRAEIAARVAEAGGTPAEINRAVEQSSKGLFGTVGGIIILASIGYLVWRANQ